MNRKILVLMAMITLATLASMAFLTYSMGNGKQISSTEEYRDAVDTDIPVFVIGEDGNAKDIFAAVSFGTDIVRISQSFDDYNSEDIVIIDGGWIGKNNRSDI